MPPASCSAPRASRLRRRTTGEISSRADDYRAQALAPLSGEMIVHGAGGELVPTDSGKGAAEWRLLDTADNPNYVTADASRGRLDLAQQAGALEEALDAADTIEARDSLERMLAHQLATAHVSAMKMSADLNRRLDYLANVRGEESERVNIQATRLAGAVGRLMSTYQQGNDDTATFPIGGQQTVVVQHVQANRGSRVVVAGKVGRGAWWSTPSQDARKCSTARWSLIAPRACPSFMASPLAPACLFDSCHFQPLIGGLAG